MTFIFHFIYGMSSFPLTFIFFKVVIAPPTSITIKPIMNDSTQGSEFRSITGFKFHLRSWPTGRTIFSMTKQPYPYRGFLKWWYPQFSSIFNRIFHSKPSSYWGTSLMEMHRKRKRDQEICRKPVMNPFLSAKFVREFEKKNMLCTAFKPHCSPFKPFTWL